MTTLLRGHYCWWNTRLSRYACSCGKAVYEGGEKKAQQQHRQHKAELRGEPTPAEMLANLRTAVTEYVIDVIDDRRHHAPGVFVPVYDTVATTLREILDRKECGGAG